MAMLTVDLDDDEHRALKLLALRRGTTMSRIVRELLASELAALSDADRATVAEWAPARARAVLGITEDTDQATREQVDAAVAAAHRSAEAIYGTPDAGAA
jgi:predicted transcriptional regulator